MSGQVESNKLIEQAAAFHARVAASDMSADDWRELEKWLDQDAEHRAIFDAMGSMTDSLATLAHRADDQALQEASPALAGILADSEQIASARSEERQSSTPRRFAIAAGLLVALVVPALYFVGQFGGPAPTATVYQTQTAERLDVELADGSVLAINADSRVAVTYSDSERSLFLEHGEIQVDVAADARRPFRVSAGNYVVVAIGTAFNVRYRGGDLARVTVREGRVAVSPSVTDPLVDPVELRAGQRLLLGPGAEPVNLSPDEVTKSLAWRDGWLHFNNERLGRVIEELRPYFDRPIIITDARAASLEVGGSFNVDQSGPVLAALQTLLPITITDDEEKILIKYDEDNGPN